MANKIPRTHHRRPGQKLSATILLATSAGLHTVLYVWATWVASTTAMPPEQSLPLMIAAAAMTMGCLFGAFRLNKLRRSAWRTGLRVAIAGGAIMPLATILPRYNMPDLGNTRWEQHIFVFSLVTAIITIAWAARLLYVTRTHTKELSVPPDNDAPNNPPITRQDNGVINLTYAQTSTPIPPRRATAAVLIVTGILHALVLALCISVPNVGSVFEMLVTTIWIGAITLWCFGGAVAMLARILICWRLLVGLAMVAATITPAVAFIIAINKSGCAGMGWGFIVLYPSALNALCTLIPGAALLIFGRNK